MGFFIGGGNNSGANTQIDNFSKTYNSADWVLVDDMYELEVVHGQGTKKILVNVYENGIDANINGVQLLDENKLKLTNDTAIDCMVIINSGSRVPVIVNDFSGGNDKFASAETVKVLNEKIDSLKFITYDEIEETK